MSWEVWIIGLCVSWPWVMMKCEWRLKICCFLLLSSFEKSTSGLIYTFLFVDMIWNGVCKRLPIFSPHACVHATIITQITHACMAQSNSIILCLIAFNFHLMILSLSDYFISNISPSWNTTTSRSFFLLVSSCYPYFFSFLSLNPKPTPPWLILSRMCCSLAKGGNSQVVFNLFICKHVFALFNSSREPN